MTHDGHPDGEPHSEVVGALLDGTPIRAYTLRGGTVTLRALDYGGIVTHLLTLDRHRTPGDIVLGHDQLEGYLTASPYFGALIGRCANRIAHGGFVLDGHRHELARNDEPHALHGGVCGFDKVRWDVVHASRDTLVLSHSSPHGHEGYPGTLRVTVCYRLTALDQWVIDYEATTDAPTPVNLTHHSYWNLSANPARDVLDHMVTLHADHFTPVDPTLIPMGVLQHVDGTPFDFRAPHRIGERIDALDEQLRHAGGYDHNWVLGGPPATTGPVPECEVAMPSVDHSVPPLRHAAHVWDAESGRTLDVYTSEPGVQFYTGNFLDGSICGKGGIHYGKHAGLCLETQRFPDAPNQPSFPEVTLRPGDRYRSRTIHVFGVKNG